MIVLFDKRVQWQPTAGDLTGLEDENAKRYFASSPPHLVVLEVYPEALEDHDDAFYLHRGKYDCSVGWHRYDAPTGYTLPQYCGYTHTKITVHKPVQWPIPASITLSEILQAAPTEDVMSEYRPEYTLNLDLEQLTVKLPPMLVATLRDMAARRGWSLDQTLWYALHYWVEDNL